jgi:hypothetical protein
MKKHADPQRRRRALPGPFPYAGMIQVRFEGSFSGRPFDHPQQPYLFNLASRCGRVNYRIDGSGALADNRVIGSIL